MPARRSHWGWGLEEAIPADEDLGTQAAAVRAGLGLGAPPDDEVELPLPLDKVALRACRVPPPPALAEVCSTEVYDRALHTYGRSYRDVIQGFRGRFDHAPDVVAYPRDEAGIAAVLEWAEGANAAVIPFGGGTSVVGGVEPRLEGALGARYDGVVSLDLGHLDQVVEVDRTSRAALIQAGATGPGLEAQLADHGLTLRHFPQSFELATLGGWIATRSGGHYATLYTHIDDLVESVRTITPRGTWESRRLPGSGAGPSPDRLMLGSEGILGVITQAWVRVQDKPTHRASAGVRFRSFDAAVEAVRALSQSGLHPTNCRLIDATEARLTAGGDGEHALLVLGFESADHPVDPWMARARELAEAHGGLVDPPPAGRGGMVGAWRDSFLRAPYLRNLFPTAGVLGETFETAITWDRFPEFHRSVKEAAVEAIRTTCGGGVVSCRFTYAYPDGPAPYYTIYAPARRGEEVEQWDALKAVVSDALIACGGTITHHHAVGRDHRPWYDRQRPAPFADALRAAKGAVDPAGILNPGVLIDPGDRG